MCINYFLFVNKLTHFVWTSGVVLLIVEVHTRTFLPLLIPFKMTLCCRCSSSHLITPRHQKKSKSDLFSCLPHKCHCSLLHVFLGGAARYRLEEDEVAEDNVRAVSLLKRTAAPRLRADIILPPFLMPNYIPYSTFVSISH